MKSSRILLVEDEALIAMDTEDALVDAGYAVVGPADRLDTALALARAAPIDAAVLDVNLAGSMVWPVATALQQRGIPYVLLTGFGAYLDAPAEHRAVAFAWQAVPKEGAAGGGGGSVTVAVSPGASPRSLSLRRQSAFRPGRARPRVAGATRPLPDRPVPRCGRGRVNRIFVSPPRTRPARAGRHGHRRSSKFTSRSSAMNGNGSLRTAAFSIAASA